MKVLLHADIEGVGYLGDVVEVSDGYGRNYLLPEKLAVRPTQDNIKTIQKERAKKSEMRRLVREKLLKVAEQVNDAEVTIKALANEQGHLFGSVSEEDVASALREKGYEIKTKNVVMPEHFRKLDTYEVPLRFEKDIEAKVQVHVVRPDEEQDHGDESKTSGDE